MFSKSCEYGIKAAVFIANESSEGRKTGIKEIAHQIGSPEAFTAKILQTLVKEQIIASSKGPSGGFYIPKQLLAEIKIASIVSAIDGDSIFTGCILGLDVCSNDSPCPLHNDFRNIGDNLNNMLSSISLKDLLEKLNLKQTFLKR